MTDVTRNLIELAVTRLFTSGVYDRIVDRLVMTSYDERDLGGWGREAVTRTLTEVLGTRFDELENLLHALTARCGQQSEILTRNAERRPS